MNKALQTVDLFIRSRMDKLMTKRAAILDKYPEDIYGLKWMDKVSHIDTELYDFERIRNDLHSKTNRADLYEDLLRSANMMINQLVEELNKYDPHTVQTIQRRYGRKI